MSTIKVTNLKHETSASDNISLDSSANTTIGGNLIAQAGSASTPAIQATGDANTGIYFSGADAVDVATGGTQALQLDSSQNLRFNSGYGSVATAYGVRAWINFDGTSGSIGTGRGSGNMDAVTDHGTGDYTVNFTNDMPDANYAAFGASGTNGTTAGSGRSFQPNKTSPAVGSFRFSIRTSSTNADFNDDLVYVCIVR